MKRVIRGERIYLGMPVRDAKQSMLVQPSKEDIKAGVRGDPEHCAYAECLRRTLRSSVVYIYNTIAYVEVLDERGNHVLERYTIKDGTRENMENFDGGVKVEPAGFKLREPTKSQTLDYKMKMRAKQRRSGLEAKWNQTRAEKLAAEKAGKSVKRHKRKAPTEGLASFRYGTGCVKFYGTAEGRLIKHHA